MATVLWFKRDLRVRDNAALSRAVSLGNPVPLYIIEPDYWRLDDTSGRQFAFLRETLSSLRDALRARGSDLVIRMGEATDVLDAVMAETRASRLVSHQETGNAWTFARDRRIAAWARDRGVIWEELPNSAVLRGRHDRDRWAAHRTRVVGQPLLEAPQALPPVAVRSDAIPDARDLGLDDICPGRQPGGLAEAEQTLASFLATRGQTYRRAMSSPVTAATACSRLSPHLAWGALSVRQVVRDTAVRQSVAKGARDGWSGSLASYQSRLAWRDHFIQKLEDEPALEWRALHRAYDDLRPDMPDRTRLAAWQAGETGIPFVDACMRSLAATGWLNFRMRAMITSFASYHLWLPWQTTGAWMARAFTDYEPGIHWSQIQMQSGTTGINTLRIYNPVKQGRDQDPDGVFTRRWVPELAALPDRHLQEPWKAGHPPTRYPSPIVDLVEAGRAARAAMTALRRDPSHRDEAARVVQKHASRKDRHFVNDRAPRRRASKSNPNQLSFDL